jgi:hypothetical protein
MLAISLFCLATALAAGIEGTHETHYTLPDGRVLVSSKAADIKLDGSSLPRKTTSDNDLLLTVGMIGFAIFGVGAVIVAVNND